MAKNLKMGNVVLRLFALELDEYWIFIEQSEYLYMLICNCAVRFRFKYMIMIHDLSSRVNFLQTPF